MSNFLSSSYRPALRFPTSIISLLSPSLSFLLSKPFSFSSPFTFNLSAVYPSPLPVHPMHGSPLPLSFPHSAHPLPSFLPLIHPSLSVPPLYTFFLASLSPYLFLFILPRTCHFMAIHAPLSLDALFTYPSTIAVEKYVKL